MFDFLKLMNRLKLLVNRWLRQKHHYFLPIPFFFVKRQVKKKRLSKDAETKKRSTVVFRLLDFS